MRQPKTKKNQRKKTHELFVGCCGWGPWGWGKFECFFLKGANQKESEVIIFFYDVVCCFLCVCEVFFG